MKATRLTSIQYKFPATFILMLICLVSAKPASAQIDYSYGLNKSGFRLGLGAGVTTLYTHYHQNPAQLAGIGSLDYDFNPYFSIGLEAQAGKLKGVDDLHHLYIKTSSDVYLNASFNVRFGVGLITDFYTNNGFQEAIKKVYIGVGVGRIRVDNTFTYNDDLAPYKPEDVRPTWQMWSFPFNLGTNIDLRGKNGGDRFTLNPNYQFSYVNDYFLDGYRTSTQYSHLKGFYSVASIKIKYKF